jgi:hypothetical protein
MILPITSVSLTTPPQMQHVHECRVRTQLVIANMDWMPDKGAVRL